MSYPINYPTPQGANVQIFRGGDASTTAHVATRDWVKPQGASFVFFTLIGAGGGGGGGVLDGITPIDYFGGGGASGNVTNFMCPAFLIPDVLQVAIGKGGNGGAKGLNANASNGVAGNPTQIIYQQKDNQGYTLLQASGGGDGGGAIYDTGQNGVGGTGQAADTGGPMTAAGFYNATGGQNGANGNTSISVNNITFVMGGDGTNNAISTITGYYGYAAPNTTGYSQISPIIMAISGSPSGTPTNRRAPSPFGCGGNGGSSTENGSTGGDGLAIIVTW
jgi:hypothetical protein